MLTTARHLPVTIDRACKLYQPRGGAKALFPCRDTEVLIEGPAGTGKSRAVLEKVNRWLLKCPGSRALIVRKTRESMSQSVLVTFEEKVLPDNPDIYPQTDNVQRMNRQSYVYPNGSELVVGGLDKPAKIMSTEYDMIAVFEATEATESDWEMLLTRLRNFVMPFQQIIADCNPASPAHWLNQRASKPYSVPAGMEAFLPSPKPGQMQMARLLSRHEDNPSLHDGQSWTKAGISYLAKLARLTGARLLRLMTGKWAASEGLVYEIFGPANVIDVMPEGWQTWRKIRSIDFGYTNPFVCQWWAIDPDGRMYLYRELYLTKILVDQGISQKILDYSAGERYEETVADHDGQYRLRLNQAGIDTLPAIKAIEDGIQAVQARLKVQPDKLPRLLILRSALTERDRLLEEAKLPIGTLEEMDAYVWPKGSDGKSLKEVPVDKDNHACFVGGTLVRTLRGDIPIEQVRPSVDFALTRHGFRKIISCGMTCPEATVFNVLFSDGRSLVGTGNHPVWVTGKGFVRMDALRYSDIITSCEVSASGSKALISDDTLNQKTGRIGFTLLRQSITAKMDLVVFTKRFGRKITALFRTEEKFITAMETRSITPLVISNASRTKNTSFGTKTIPTPASLSSEGAMFGRPGSSQSHGIAVKWEENGTRLTRNDPSRIENVLKRDVSSAERNLSPSPEEETIDFVLTRASRRGGDRKGSTWFRENAKHARLNFSSIDSSQEDFAPVSVQVVREDQKKQPVFNLSVAGDREFFANGILVHNCDALRYAVMYIDQNASAPHLVGSHVVSF